jgi:murein DD-endopeptidase MepM/ murein hydrolase activator NlpD
MRHARRAAALVITLSLAVTLTTTATVAQAIDSPGGTPAPTAGSASQAGGEAAGGTGATRNPARGTGGSSGSAPSTKGTGGSEYGVAVSSHKVVSKKAPRKPVRAVHRKPTKPKPTAKPKPKPAAPKPPTPAPVPAPAPTLPAGAPSPAQTASEGAVFPVVGAHSFGDAANRFGAGRAGHEHQGQDVLASEGLAVVAPLAGTIITTGYQAGGAGWYVVEHTRDGLDFFYAHCQAGSLAVTAAGQAVAAGQALCTVGQTGDATGPHLHFEVWVGGWRASGGKPIDPLAYLQAWDHS